MASNLAGGVCIGQLNACVLRVAALDNDCAPIGGTNGGIVSTGLVTLTADPDIEPGATFEPRNGCGKFLYTYEEEPRIKRMNLSGELGFFDYEAMQMLFGGTLILGKSGGLYVGEVIGYAARLYSAARRNGVYLEVITQAIVEGQGDCQPADTIAPQYVGHIFGNAKLNSGSRTFTNEAAMLTFAGTASNNPSLFNGPWNDYPGAGYITNSPHVMVGYSQAEYDGILNVVGCGYKNQPTGS